MSSFAHSAAIVTGVSRGLGEALAAELLARGFQVLGIGRASSMRLAGENYRFAECDLARPPLIAASVAPALRDLADVATETAILVNNAALAAPAGVLGAIDAAALETAIATNVTAPMVLVDLFCRAFPAGSAKRRVLNISSGAAQTAIPGSSAYCVSKAALEMLTRAIAADHPDVESIALRPGIFDTGMQAYLRAQDPHVFPSANLFRGFKAGGLLKAPSEVARQIVDRFVIGSVVQGHVYNHTDLAGASA